MNFEFTISETEHENLHDGNYIAIVGSVEEKMDKYGTYVSVEWNIQEPEAFWGRSHAERFYIGHNDEFRKGKAVAAFSRFCKQISNLQTGDKLTDDHLVGKKAELTIKNNISADGKVYVNVINRMLVGDTNSPDNGDNTVMYGKIAIPQETQTFEPLNDEVPF